MAQSVVGYTLYIIQRDSRQIYKEQTTERAFFFLFVSYCRLQIVRMEGGEDDDDDDDDEPML